MAQIRSCADFLLAWIVSVWPSSVACSQISRATRLAPGTAQPCLPTMRPSSIGACRCGVVLSLVAAHHSTTAFQPIPSTSIAASLAHRQSISWPTRRSPRVCSQASAAAAAKSEGKDNVNEQGDIIVPKEKAYSKLSRLYVGGDPVRTSALCKGARVHLSADQSHYLSNVMRIFGKGKRNKRHGSSGDDENLAQCVRLFDGVNGEWLARVSAVDDDDADTDAGRKMSRRRKRGAPSNLSAECLLQLRQQHRSNEEESPWLLFAPIKKHRAKFLVEKCTELGCCKFVPIITDRTDPAAVTGCIGAHQSMDALEKLSVQALEASEQCERLSVPVVTPNIASTIEVLETWDVPTLLEKWCTCDNGDEDITANRRLLVCRERMPGNGILSRLANEGGVLKNDKRKSVAFLVGPEGGWSEEEEKLFEQYAAQHHEIIQSVSLGDFVLRAETAAMTCIAAWNLSRENE